MQLQDNLFRQAIEKILQKVNRLLLFGQINFCGQVLVKDLKNHLSHKNEYLGDKTMWSIFKDENEYNEKAIIGFISFALMCVFGIVDLVMGIIGIELMVNDYIYNSFVWVTLGSFGIAGAEKVYKK